MNQTKNVQVEEYTDSSYKHLLLRTHIKNYLLSEIEGRGLVLLQGYSNF